MQVRVHPWMTRRSAEADILVEHQGPAKVDSGTRDMMQQMGLPLETIDTSLATERHDHLTTTYLLLARRKQMQKALAEEAHHLASRDSHLAKEAAAPPAPTGGGGGGGGREQRPTPHLWHPHGP